jgi:hypothetical protein
LAGFLKEDVLMLIRRTSINSYKVFFLAAIVSLFGLLAGVGHCGIETVSYQVSAGAGDRYAWGAVEQGVNSWFFVIGDRRD